MSGILGITGGLGVQAGRSLARGGGGAFRLEPSATPPATATSATTAAQSIAMGLLALQETGAVAERNARARKRGQALIDALRDLQAGLLRGRVDGALLRHLTTLSDGEEAADPALAQAVAAIALRARIECARITAAGLVARG